MGWRTGGLGGRGLDGGVVGRPSLSPRAKASIGQAVPQLARCTPGDRAEWVGLGPRGCARRYRGLWWAWWAFLVRRLVDDFGSCDLRACEAVRWFLARRATDAPGLRKGNARHPAGW
jgi:hypothetical protein